MSGRYEVDKRETLAATAPNFPQEHRDGMRKALAETLDASVYSLEVFPDGRYQTTVGLAGVTSTRRGNWSIQESVFTLEQTHEDGAAKQVTRVGSFENGRLTIRDIDGVSVVALRKLAN